MAHKVFGYCVMLMAVLSFLTTQWYFSKVESSSYLEFISIITQIVTFISGIVITKLTPKE